MATERDPRPMEKSCRLYSYSLAERGGKRGERPGSNEGGCYAVFFERQLAPPAALRQSCSDEFERSMSRWPPPNKCDCRKRRNADHPFDPEIAPRRLLFFLSAERVSAGKRWLLGAAGNAVRAEGRRISVPLPRKEMCSTSSPTGWCHCHHDTTSALCCAEPRSVGALDRTPLPVGCLASEKSTIYMKLIFSESP